MFYSRGTFDFHYRCQYEVGKAYLDMVNTIRIIPPMAKPMVARDRDAREQIAICYLENTMSFLSLGSGIESPDI
jgi:hypothetical protein